MKLPNVTANDLYWGFEQNSDQGTKTEKKMGCQKVAYRGLLHKTAEALFFQYKKLVYKIASISLHSAM